MLELALAGVDVPGRVGQQHVGRHALALGRRAADPEELLDRDLEDTELDPATGGAIQIRERLHGALAVGRAGADDDRASVVLERTGDDL